MYGNRSSIASCEVKKTLECSLGRNDEKNLQHFTHLQDLNLEIIDRRRVALAAAVDGLGREHSGSAHVVGQHLHQEVNVTELRRQSRPHNVVRACHHLARKSRQHVDEKMRPEFT